MKNAIARECSKRHVPKYIFETPEIPTTGKQSSKHPSQVQRVDLALVNAKKVELPIKHIVNGRTVKPSGTLLNPESLDFYYQFAKIEDVVAKSLGRQSKL
jgi:acetoacetyl-CoA synthetase